MMAEYKQIPWPPTFWTDTMIEDATYVPCGPLREGEDIAVRLEKTQQWWDELLGRGTIETFLHGNGQYPLPLGVIHLDGST